MKCPECRTEKVENFRFCFKCHFDFSPEQDEKTEEKVKKPQKTPKTFGQKIEDFFKTLALVLALYFLLAFACAFYLAANNPHERANISKCKSNLRQLATALELYVDMRARGSRYPPFNGSEFWAALYRTEVLIDANIYLCPSTDDFNDEGKLLLGTYDSGNPPPTACSYGGRLNKNKKTKIFTGRNASKQPIGCDDNEDTDNHRKVVNIVFLDTSARSYTFNTSSPNSSDSELGGKRIGAGILKVCGN